MTALIIDGNHLAYRCRYAYNLSWQGQDTSVTYGFMRVLISYLQRFHPEIVIVAWDSGIPMWRKQLINAYKANRTHQADPNYHQFLEQIAELRRALPNFGVVQAWRNGIEADDLAYHASHMLDCHCVVVSGDADLLQAVDEQVDVLKPGKTDTLITLETFEQIVGVPPQHYVWYRALQGDSSDNLRGCPGIGPKVAKKLLTTVDNPYYLEHLVAAAPKKVRADLQAYIDSGRHAAVLDVICLAFDLVGARQTLLSSTWQRYDTAYATQWCLTWGFASLIQAGSMGQLFGKLHRPIWHLEDYHVPLIWSYRRDPLT